MIGRDIEPFKTPVHVGVATKSRKYHGMPTLSTDVLVVHGGMRRLYKILKNLANMLPVVWP